MGSTEKERLTSRELQAAERRHQLLEAAKELFANKGFHNTSTKEINRTIGMADGLIYHYFPKGKLEILHTIVQESTKGRLQNIVEAIKETDDQIPIRDKLLNIAKTIAEDAHRDRKLLIILIREQPSLLDKHLEWLPQAFEAIISHLSSLLDKRVLKGELRQVNCRLMARQFLSTIQSLIIEQGFLGNSSRDHSEFDRELTEMVDFLLECWR
ncbi:TetR/AcrR family transcriptional regulator [Paenibacillus caui]|uniref:TetR/AcrR family transcriptional regulator n=1 Tax=Paenibacillus caui TaxID=2873927 RepID=UPI001CA9553E|nr:TetR/AcrR family transcriptional regulator [Paenibacillus caui]